MPPVDGRGKGDILFHKREYPPLEPQEKGLDWQSQACASLLPPEWKCLRAALPRLELQDDLTLLLLSAAALPVS